MRRFRTSPPFDNSMNDFSSPGWVTPFRTRGTAWPSRCVRFLSKPKSALTGNYLQNKTGLMNSRTSSIPIVSLQYRLVSFLRQLPLSFLLLTRITTSPASQSGLSSASPSKTTSWPSGVPGVISRVSSWLCSTTLLPLQWGQVRLMTLPRPWHSLHVTWLWANIPGKICCLTILTPAPLHPPQVWISLSDAAPVPLQWSQSTCFRNANCEHVQ